MGGGAPISFLNKKPWHPSRVQNQEEVWKREQAAAAEKKKLEELRQQYEEERRNAEFMALAQAHQKGGAGDRLDWMYSQGLAAKEDAAKRQEEALLGQRAAQLNTAEAAEPSRVDMAANLASVSASAVPASQNEQWARLNNDPLLMIKRQQQEVLKKLRDNPIKMQEILKQVQQKSASQQQDPDVRDKRHKKEKKHKHKSKDKRRSRSRGHSSDSGSGREDRHGHAAGRAALAPPPLPPRLDSGHAHRNGGGDDRAAALHRGMWGHREPRERSRTRSPSRRGERDGVRDDRGRAREPARYPPGGADRERQHDTRRRSRSRSRDRHHRDSGARGETAGGRSRSHSGERRGGHASRDDRGGRTQDREGGDRGGGRHAHAVGTDRERRVDDRHEDRRGEREDHHSRHPDTRQSAFPVSSQGFDNGRGYGLSLAGPVRDEDRSTRAAETMQRLAEAQRKREEEERAKAATTYQRQQYKTGRLTDEERARKLAEMSGNAEQHDTARLQRLERAAAADGDNTSGLANTGGLAGTAREGDAFLAAASRDVYGALSGASLEARVNSRRHFAER